MRGGVKFSLMIKQQKIAEKRAYDVTPRYIPVKIINQYDIQLFSMQKIYLMLLKSTINQSGNFFYRI